jgi:hypothetical protein
MHRSAIAFTVLIIVLLAVILWQAIGRASSSIQLSFAAEQTEIFEDMVAKASQSLGQARPGDKTDMFAVLRQVADEQSRRGLIVLISDLLVDREGLFRGEE